MKWKDKLINDFKRSLQTLDGSLSNALLKKISDERITLHLAVFSEPFLSLIMEGEKTMESRFSVNQVVPFGKVGLGDVVIMKKSGGDIVGFFTARKVYFYSGLNATKVSELEQKYGNQLFWNIDPDFISTKSDSNYLTLIEISNVVPTRPIVSDKSDRTGWAIVKLGLQNTLFSDSNMELKLTIGIIGKISSGKSTIAKKIKEHYGIPIISFGKYLVDYSTGRGLQTDREALQDLGEKFIKEDSSGFLTDVLDSQSGQPDAMIVEGIRHLAIRDELRARSENSVFIFVNAPVEIRYKRYSQRKKASDSVVTFEEFEQIDNHPVEHGINTLRDICDIQIESDLPDDDLFALLDTKLGT